MKINVLLTALMVLLSFSLLTVSAQQSQPTKPKMFVAPTNDGFSNFISAALIENKVPVSVTADDGAADFIIVCSSAKGQNKWYDTWFGTEKDRNQGSMKVIRVSDKTVVWASASGDKSFWWGGLKDMGQEKVANRLARKLRGDFAKVLTAKVENPIESGDNKSKVAEIIGGETNTVKPAPAKVLTAEEYNQPAVKLFNEKKYAEAETAFREAVRLEPYGAAYHFNLGTALNILNKFDEAEKEAELATRLAPADATYRAGLEVIRTNKYSRTAIKLN